MVRLPDRELIRQSLFFADRELFQCGSRSKRSDDVPAAVINFGTYFASVKNYGSIVLVLKKLACFFVLRIRQKKREIIGRLK